VQNVHIEMPSYKIKPASKAVNSMLKSKEPTTQSQNGH
jgi:hypothetical protein